MIKMEATKFYSLPKLAYGYKDLEPHMSEQQLTIHHQKHHQACVKGANSLLEKLDRGFDEASE
jgi:Fe-Mn family superoxide dismutase